MGKAKSYARLGSDLALTRYTGVPASLPLQDADSWGTLDLQAVPGKGAGPQKATEVRDLGAVSGRDNLAQALILRLLTQKGALAALGHPGYGSRLVELIGQLNDETSRNLARLYTIEAVSQEPRVRHLLDLSVDTAESGPDTLRISFSVVPLDDDEPLGLALDVTL
jgi:phage baseplate assembly protein W